VFTLLGRRGNVNSGNIQCLGYKRFRASGNIEKIRNLLVLLFDHGLLDIDEDGWENPDDPIAIQFPQKFKSIPGVYIDWFIEDVSQQMSIKTDFESLVKKHMGIYSVNPQAQKNRGDKRQRLMAITGQLETGKLTFNRYRFGPKENMIRELIFFGSTQHDDCVDSLTCGVIGLGYRIPLS
jgi:hypothetical protein